MLRQKTVEMLSIALFATLLVFGTYMTLAYYGQPIHLSVLLSPEWKTSVQQSCPGLGVMCGGWYGFGPAIAHSFGRAAPFLWYVILSAVAFGLYLGGRAVVSHDPAARLRLKPWMPVALFVGLLWLLFTVLTAGTVDGRPVREIVEPVPAVYQGITPEALRALQDNFAQLQSDGCLRPAGELPVGAGIFTLSSACVQGAFFTTVLPPLLFLLLLVLNFLVLGRAILHHVLRARTARIPLEALFSVALGAAGLIVILWALAVARIYVGAAGWILLLGIPVALYRHTIYWAETAWSREWEVKDYAWGVSIFLGWLLLSYLALNYLTLIRPFPLGWDDLGSYMNRPRLLVSYGHFIPTMSTFQWEYLSSLGFLLFGYTSDLAATVAMEINWLSGLLACLAIIVLMRTYLGKGGVLATLLYYTLPMVGHFSFADMKIDNAVFFFITTGLLALFLYLFPPHSEDEGNEPQDLRWVAVAGVLLGIAFGTKVTAIMPILAAFAVLLGGLLHWVAGPAVFLLSLVLYHVQGTFQFERVIQRVLPSMTAVPDGIIIGVLALLGVGLLLFAARKGKHHLRRSLTATGVLAGTVALSVAPWIIHNNILSGNIIPRPVFGAPNTYAPVLDVGRDGLTGAPGQPVIALPKELAVDTDTEACRGTSGVEELDRYWGNRTGIGHYLTLPWRAVMNTDSIGYYVTLSSALLLFPLLLLLPYFWFPGARWLRWLFGGTILLIAQWMLLANGVPWYGIGMFLGLCVAGEILVSKAPDLPNKMMAGLLIFLSLVTCFAFRFWQFEQQRYLYEYAMGKVSGDVLRERTILHYEEVAQTIVERKEADPKHPYVYRAGTFIPYFVPRNLEVIAISDNQLDFFNCLNQDRDPKKTLARLKALGFNSVIFDTNTHTIEKDQNGTLHQKVARFVDFLVNHPELGIRAEVADPGAGIAFFLLP